MVVLMMCEELPSSYSCKAVIIEQFHDLYNCNYNIITQPQRESNCTQKSGQNTARAQLKHVQDHYRKCVLVLCFVKPVVPRSHNSFHVHCAFSKLITYQYIDPGSKRGSNQVHKYNHKIQWCLHTHCPHHKGCIHTHQYLHCEKRIMQYQN